MQMLSLIIRNFSPVPKRVMDGSEPGESVVAAVLSGAPIDLQARTVRYEYTSLLSIATLTLGPAPRIYKPAKSAMQSGNWHSHHWRMDWDVPGKGHRMLCKARISTLFPKTTPFVLRKSKDTNTLFKSQTSGNLRPRHMRTISYTFQGH